MSRLNVILVIVVIIGAVIISSFGATAMQRLQAGFLSVISPSSKPGLPSKDRSERWEKD